MRSDVRSWFSAMAPTLRGAFALLLVALAIPPGCGGEPLPCKSSADCAHGGALGLCEKDGWCSFADATCSDSHRRYGEAAAAELAGTCVTAAVTCVAAVGLGGRHTCALKKDGSVWCWGGDDSGQLGDTSAADVSAPKKIAGVPAAVKLAVGESHACALTDAGEVWCWGANDAGQLGATSGTPPVPVSSPAPVKVDDLPAAQDLSAGGKHTCAVTKTGDVYCWGSNNRGQLGDGTRTTRPRPVKIAAAGAAKSIAAGNGHTCAARQDGAITCWGSNEWGQIGLDSPTTESLVPEAATRMGDGGADQIAAGRDHTCILRDKTVSCWGSSGDVSVTPSLAVVTGPTAAHACALVDRGGGELWCWGGNQHGQLGTSSTAGSVTDPARAAVAMATSVGGAGAQHTCDVDASGALRCWGDDEFGQLGASASGKDSLVPLEVGICP